MKVTIKLLLIFYPIVFNVNLFSQEVVKGLNFSNEHFIKGAIIDNKSGLGLENITVKLFELSNNKLIDYSNSDSKGVFNLKPLKEGDYLVRIESIGYKEVVIKVLISNNSQNLDLGKIKLEEGRLLNEIVVSAETPILSYQGNKIVYDVSRDPERFKLSMLRMMERLPFTRINNEGLIEYKFKDLNYILLINGKEHRLINKGRQYPMALIKAGYMKNIEIISPPPADYSEYDAVINITLSNPLPNGFATQISLNGSTVNEYMVSPGIVFKVGKAVASLDYNSTYNKPKSLKTESYQENFLSAANRFTHRVGNTENNSNNNSISVGSSYDFNDNSFVSCSFSTNGAVNKNFSNTSYLTKNIEGLINESISTNIFGELRNKPKFNIGLKFFKMAKNKSYNVYLRVNSTNSMSEYINEMKNVSNTSEVYDETTFEQNKNFINNINLFARKTIKKVICYLSIDYVNRKYKTNTEGTNNNDVYLSKGILYDQNILNTSISISYTLNKNNTVSCGLKTNSAFNKGVFNNNGIHTGLNNKDLVFLPMLNLNIYKGTFSFSLFYQSNISRPGISQLNPYLDKSDPSFLKTGNPELLPEKNHSFQLSSEVRLKNNMAIFVGITGTLTNNSIEQYTYLDADNFKVLTYENIGHKNTISFSLGFDYRINRVLKFSSNLRLSKNYFNSPTIKNQNTSIFLPIDISGELWKGSDIRIYGGLTQGKNSVQITKKNILSYIGLSLSQSIIKDKFYGSVSVSNPFEKNQTIINEIRTDTFYSKDEYDKIGRSFSFSLRFIIGNFKGNVKGVGSVYSDDLKK